MISGSLIQADFPMHLRTGHVLAATAIAVALLCLSACGGQGDRPPPSASTGSGGGNTGGSGGSSFTPGVFLPYAGFPSQCAVPRTGTDPNTQQPYPDVQGSATSENNWLRSWTNDTYLWYSEVVDANPASYATPAYFELMKTTATTASGRPKDQFHFSIPTAEWEALSQSGVSAGYGAQWFIISEAPPREIRVAYVEPGSPAAAAGVLRGDTVLTVDGADAVNGDSQAIVDTLNAGLFPENVNETHQFTLRDVAGVSRDVTLQSANVTSVPVQNVAALATNTGPVGYMLFNDHIATAESALVNAITSLQTAGVTDLVLDIRYNGGGFLDIASELAFMIAGPTPTTGQTFERISFNNKHTTTDPVTGEPLTPVPFHSTTQNFSAGNGNPLPTLNLQRVFVLTGSGTCSASESIINGLRGVDVEVIQIGGTTCGKPYGFYPTPNCGTTYFSIQFQGVNAKSFGDYADGFSPVNTVSTPGVTLPGCSVQDDFTHALGDADEARLAAALAYRETPGTCPAAPTGPVAKAKTQFSKAPVEGDMHKSPMRENRILRR